MDGTISDFESGFLNKWRELHPFKEWIPLEDRTTHFIEAQYRTEYSKDIMQILTSPGFYRNLQPIAGSVEALNELRLMGHHVYICTTPMEEFENCVLEKYYWIERHLGREWTNRTILSRDKTLVHADILIDDRPDIKGVNKPTWRHYLYDQPYNRHIKLPRLNWNTWKQILFSQVEIIYEYSK